MKFAFQIPHQHLKDIQGDIDFALAHLVLQGGNYADFYEQQSADGREVILDNGLHELGAPLAPSQIVKAAEIINPSWIIPPDWHGDSLRTMKAVEICRGIYDSLRIGPVVQGDSYIEFVATYKTYIDMGFNIICFPYRTSAWRLQLLLEEAPKYPTIRHHLLGMQSLRELKLLPPVYDISLDTGKPFRWAQHPPSTTTFNKLDMNKQCHLPAVVNYIQQMREALWSVKHVT